MARRTLAFRESERRIRATFAGGGLLSSPTSRRAGRERATTASALAAAPASLCLCHGRERQRRATLTIASTIHATRARRSPPTGSSPLTSAGGGSDHRLGSEGPRRDRPMRRSRTAGCDAPVGRARRHGPLAGLAQCVNRSPLTAGIIGAGRSWTACTISVLSMPRKYTDVTPRSACPSCRWMTTSGTPSRDISTA